MENFNKISINVGIYVIKRIYLNMLHWLKSTRPCNVGDGVLNVLQSKKIM